MLSIIILMMVSNKRTLFQIATKQLMSKVPAIFSGQKKNELIFMRLGGSRASPGNLSQLFSIVH